MPLLDDPEVEVIPELDEPPEVDEPAVEEVVVGALTVVVVTLSVDTTPGTHFPSANTWPSGQLLQPTPLSA